MRVLVAIVAGLGVLSGARAYELSGVVLDSAGRPAAAAIISAAAIFHSPPLRMSAVSDEQGRFQFDLPRLSAPERYALAARWQRQGADITEARDAAGKDVSIAGQSLPTLIVRLRPAGALHGKLLRAEDDGPIENAKLFLDTGEVLLTDTQGQFEAEGLAMSEHSLIPVAPGRVRQYVLFDTSLQPDTELEIRLPRGAVLRGRITDQDGQPVAGAYLHRSSSGTALTLNGWDEAAGDDGRYEYGGLSVNRLFYSLTVQAPGFEAANLDSAIDDSTAVLERDVQLRRTAAAPGSHDKKDSEATTSNASTELPRRTVRGIIRNEDGQPVAAAEIRWGSFQWDDSVKNAKSQASGEYELTDVPGGSGAVFVLAEGYAPQFVPVREGDEHIDVKLVRGVTVRGKVTGTSGKPIAGVQVIPQTHCLETGFCNPIWLSERAASTNVEGEFELLAVPPLGVTFDFLKGGYTDKRDVELKHGDTINEIQLTTGGAVHGRVVDASDRPVRNFKVRVMIPRQRSPVDKVGGYYAGYDWYGVSFTRSDGEFVLTGVPANALMRLVVSSPEHGIGIVDRAPTAPLDELAAAGDLTIKLKPYRALNVRVTAAGSNDPVASALVSLLEDELHSGEGFSWGYHDLWAERSRTDASGIAHFGQPACEDGMLIVRAPGFARKRVPWTDGKAEMRVELEPGATLAGEVRLKDSLLSEGNVRVVSAQNDFISVNLKATQGKFEFPELPAGECALSVSGAANQVLLTQRITLKPGETRALKLALELPK